MLLIYALYAIAVLIGWIVFYYVVKAAVKNGILEANIEKSIITNSKEIIPERPANSEQKKLQERYEKGEISFEFYQAEWNKLNK